MMDMFRDARIKNSVKKRIMVVSAKGGVGKSTTTVNLAAALQARGYSAGIFDGDVDGPNIPALLGIKRKADRKFHPNMMVTIEARADSPSMRPVRPFERYGLKVISLGLLMGETQAIQPATDTIGPMMTFMLRQVDWGGMDVLLIDMPPGTGEPLLSLLDMDVIDGVILVTTREGLAHQDNGRMLNLLRQRMVNVIGVVENMTHIVCPNCGELIPLYPVPVEAMQSIYRNTPILGSIPFHHGLIRQPGGGAPLPLRDEDTPAKQALLDLADNVVTKIGL